MAKKVVNPVERIERIALTGDISEPKALTPVENLMGYFPKIPQASGSIAVSQPQANDNNEGGFWNGVKNFAGTNGGRMLLGGLGTALGVGLTGGNFQDALGYGIIGAGNTASNIYKREQDAKAWAEKEADRQARKEENQANRDAQWQMLNARLDALKADRQAEYDNAVKKLGLEQDMKEQERLKELEREALKYQQGREWIMNSSLDDNKKNQALLSYDAGHYGVTLPELESNNFLAEAAEIAKNGYVGLDPEALNRNEVRYIERPRSESGEVQAFNTLMKNGVDPNLAMQMVNWRSIGDEVDLYGMKAGIDFNNNIRLENHKTGNEVYKKGVDAQIAEQKSQKDFERDLLRSQYDNELKKDFEVYKTTLPVPEVVELEQRANILRSQGYNVTAADLAMENFLNQRLNNANIQSQIDERGTTPQIKNAEYLKNNPEMSNSPVFRSGTNVSINNGQGQNEFNKQLGKNMANVYIDYQNAGNAANAQLITLNAMNKAIQNPAVYQGTGGGLVNAFKTALASAGVDVAGLDDAAIINSGKSQLMGSLRKDLMPGPMSDRDIQFLVNIVPDLGKTREQNIAILNLFTKAYQRQVEAAAFVNDYVMKNKQWDVAGQQALQEFTNRPIFTEEEKAAAIGQNAKESQDGGYGLKTGTIRGGYRYIGGNPAFEKSWEMI